LCKVTSLYRGVLKYHLKSVFIMGRCFHCLHIGTLVQRTQVSFCPGCTGYAFFSNMGMRDDCEQYFCTDVRFCTCLASSTNWWRIEFSRGFYIITVLSGLPYRALFLERCSTRSGVRFNIEHIHVSSDCCFFSKRQN